MILYLLQKLLLKGGGAGASPPSQKLPFCRSQLTLLSSLNLKPSLLTQIIFLKPYSLAMALSAQLTITFVDAGYGKLIIRCTAHPLGLKFAKETRWLHNGCYYHPDMGCLFWCDDAVVPPATPEGKVVWRWGHYLAQDIRRLHTVMWVREDKPVTMLEDVCDEEIWDGKPRQVQIQPWDQDMSPKPEMGTWGTREEEITWGELVLAPKYEEGWFEASFPEVLEVQKADLEATWTWNEGYEEWVLDEPWCNGEMEDRMAEWHKPKED
jgi:hypothetical protein